MKALPQLELSWKVLITGFLVVLSSGFLVSELFLMNTTVMADGKAGLSLDDITFQFHGDKKSNRLKNQVLGGMKQYFSESQNPDELTPEELADLQKVVAWTEKGAPESEFWLAPEAGESKRKTGPILKIFNDRGCLDCHAADATMKGNKKDSPLETYAGVSKFTKPDEGMDKRRLLMLSHVHLLGMGMMFLLVGAAVAASTRHKYTKCALIIGGMGSILFDIFGWWGVKYFGGALAPVVMASGAVMGVCFGLSVLISLYDLWITKPQA